MKIGFLFIILPLVFFNSSRGESLFLLETDTLFFEHADCGREKEFSEHRISAYLDSDIALVGTVTGVYAESSRQNGWQKVGDCIARGDNWWEDFEVAKKENAPFYPGHFWRDRQNGDILLFDRWLMSVYRIDVQNDSYDVKHIWYSGDELDNAYCKNLSTYNGNIIFSYYLLNRNSAIATLAEDMSDYRKIYECPSTLLSKSDSLDWGGLSLVPAFNPMDSTLWIAIATYNYVYVVDMNGRFQDSIAISGSDYRPPQPLRSRIKSKAVFRDWYSKFTPVISLTYIPFGYFLLQYRTGWERLCTDSIPLYTTAAWTTERQPVQLLVDKGWQLAGVSADGQILFATYGIEDEECFIVLNTVRITP